MCNTPWCAGDCEDCIKEQQWQKELEESTTTCPYRKECAWITVDVKTDRCSTCGKIQRY